MSETNQLRVHRYTRVPFANIRNNNLKLPRASTWDSSGLRPAKRSWSLNTPLKSSCSKQSQNRFSVILWDRICQFILSNKMSLHYSISHAFSDVVMSGTLNIFKICQINWDTKWTISFSHKTWYASLKYIDVIVLLFSKGLRSFQYSNKGLFWLELHRSKVDI